MGTDRQRLEQGLVGKSAQGVREPLYDATAADRVPTPSEPGPFDPKPDETARERVALLAKRGAMDEREAKYRKLVAQYGGNRRARRRARAEVDRDARKKRGAAG